MRLARTELAHGPAHLVSSGSTWHSTAPVVPGTASTQEVIAAWPDITRALADGALPSVDVAEEQLLAPVHRPSKMIAIGLNYAAHVAEAQVETPSAPITFSKFPSCLVGPRADVVVDDSLTTQCDYEVELAVVIGRRVRRVSEADALSAVFGYAVGNDVSSRDNQFADGQWDRSKSFDTYGPLGPWITTADQVPDPMSLLLTASVNGEVRQSASTKEMIHGIPRLISFLSEGITLEPGDVVWTGTPSGVGLGLQPPVFLRPGDVVRCEIEGLGVLENTFVAPPGA